ncbi:SRPBCC domain-containing protein [Frigoribacterium sp. Leaf172]|uniref:SRPBCC family protein n=1 Tax=Frigoribacterium sp. Leaf172 TaxID=1736285 RepID=UPI0006FEBCB4|nr:SRPBCC domain-containing protein [Frigoribacterium sp. Leaf172]KQR66039.1 hypothetical protein ASF89_02450 [Frigoribacterium sp. Leaf172]
MTAPASEGVEIVRDFAAPPADVFEAWTTAERFSRWFGGPAVDVPLDRLAYEPVEGAGWAATMILPDGNAMDWAGDFVEVQAPVRLVLTITDAPDAPERATVTVDLSPAPIGTTMRFTQETPGFSAEQQQGLVAGWQGFFDELAAGLPARG